MSGKPKHGQWNTGAYRSWDHMIQRCCNPNCDAYDNYGRHQDAVAMPSTSTRNLGVKK